MLDHIHRPRRRWLRRLLASGIVLVFLFAVLVVYLWVILGPRLPQGPVHLVRGADGRFPPLEQFQGGGWLNLEAYAAATRSSNRLSSSNSTVSSGPSRFACRRILLLNLSHHMLMQRVGLDLLERLTQLSSVEELTYVPDGVLTGTGGMAPDVVITLDMPAVKDPGGLSERHLEASIIARAGTTLFAGSSHYTDNLSPPVVRFRWTGDLKHESTSRGITSRSARYKLQAEDIAEQLGSALTKLFGDYERKYGPMPEVPADFYPPYRPAGPLHFLDGYEVEPLASWHRLMVHNETFWRLRATSSAAQVLGDIRAKMEAAGWRVDVQQPGGSPGNLRGETGTVLLSIFPLNDPFTRTRPAAAADEETVLYVHYLDRMAPEDLSRAIDGTLSAQAPTDLLMQFRQSWSRPQRKQALDLLETRPLDTPQAYLSVAEICEGLGRNAQAREALARAAALLLVTAEAGELEGRARDIARKLGAEDLLDTPPTPAILQAAGFAQLGPDTPIIEREVALNQPVLLFVKEPDGEVSAAGVRIVAAPSGAGGASYKFAYVDSAGGGRSWGSTGTITAAGEGSLRVLLRSKVGVVECRARQKAGEERFLLSARLLPPRG